MSKCPGIANLRRARESRTEAYRRDTLFFEVCQIFELTILAHGYLRLRCDGCREEKLAAFSCKRRGICPSCGTRRMAEAAAHLVGHVIPKVPVRQWVLSFPIPLRSLFAVHPELLAPVLQIIHRSIATFLFKQTGQKRDQAATGAVTLIQRFGSAASARYAEKWRTSMIDCNWPEAANHCEPPSVHDATQAT